MILNVSTVLGLAAATLGTLSLVSVLVTLQAMRGWRTRCLALESSLTAVRRELELVASISLKTGRRGTDSGRLTQQFGLSRCEADLVWRLHGRKKTA